MIVVIPRDPKNQLLYPYPMTRGKPMTGHCKGCGVSELQARQLCTRCYDYARNQARRQGQGLDNYLATANGLASPGRHHDRHHLFPDMVT